ncbi:MAG: DUF192 domain-containing protein [Patescibacteria group bacterium]
MKKSFYWLIVVIVIFLGFLFLQNKHAPDFHYVKIGSQTLKVDLALTNAEQEQGLSGRSILAEDEGMLFVFKQPSKNLFWMKDMNFSIDMIWFDQNMKVIYMQKNATPESYPGTFGPDGNSKYVLEVVSGFSDKNHLQVGDKIEIIR